jgi:predicted ester cyclase
VSQSEQNKTIARNFIDGAWNRRDMSIVTELVASDHISHGPFTDQFPQGVEGVTAFVSAFLTAFPDTTATIQQQEIAGDKIKTLVIFAGTHTGMLMDIPATSVQITVPVIVTDKIVNGQITETWSEWDAMEMMGQLGVKEIIR